MTKTKTIVLVSVLVLVLAGAVIAVKMLFFPSVSDRYFVLNPRRLQNVPAGLVVVRPTHFAGPTQRPSARSGIAYANVKHATWMVGRNVSFQQLMATAYGYNPGRIALPFNAPKKNFDVLVTVPKNPRVRLQTAIRRKLGYIAKKETRDTAVLALKVEDPSLPGLKVSRAGERQNGNVRNGRLYFTHMRLSVITDGLEAMLKTPVVDKTGLTNFYDFSLAWDRQTQRQIQSGTLDQETGRRILAEWGLGLEPDMANIEMLVVKKAY